MSRKFKLKIAPKLERIDEDTTPPQPVSRISAAEQAATYAHVGGHPYFNYPDYYQPIDDVPPSILATVMAERTGNFPPDDYPTTMWPKLLRPFRNRTNQKLYEHDQQLADHESRIAALETKVANLLARVSALENL